MKKIAALAVCLLFVGCGGGGGDSSGGACSSIKIAGGESCGGQANVALVEVVRRDGKGLLSCTGAYISLTSVLTAAHCFRDGASQIFIASPGNTSSGVQLNIHPLYGRTKNPAFDMAIVKVDQPLADSGPVPLLLSRSPEVGDAVVAYGYGLDESGQFARDRDVAGEAPLKATSTTFAGYAATGAAIIVSTGEGGTCGGDSGGPVVAQDSSGRYGIIGITSVGQRGCGAAAGEPTFLASTQNNLAVNFIASVVPDLAVN